MWVWVWVGGQCTCVLLAIVTWGGGDQGAGRGRRGVPGRLPEVQLQLRVQEVQQRPAGHDFRVAVVDHQPPVVDVLAADALGPRGQDDYLGLPDVQACGQRRCQSPAPPTPRPARRATSVVPVGFRVTCQPVPRTDQRGAWRLYVTHVCAGSWERMARGDGGPAANEPHRAPPRRPGRAVRRRPCYPDRPQKSSRQSPGLPAENQLEGSPMGASWPVTGPTLRPTLARPGVARGPGPQEGSCADSRPAPGPVLPAPLGGAHGPAGHGTL